MFEVGLLRVALAGAIAVLLGGAWSAPGMGGAYVAAGIALVLGLLMVVGKPEALLNSGLSLTAVDFLWVSLLAYFTGGSGSPFFPLYLLAALGIARIGSGPKAVVAAFAGVGGYLAAAVAAGGTVLPVEAGVQAGFVALFCGVGWAVGVAFRRLEDRVSEAASATAAERRRAERAEDLAPRLGPVLEVSDLDGILRWTLETARAVAGGSYVHIAEVNGNHHRTVAEGDSDVWPSWWHPTIQRLVLWSCRENKVLRSEQAIHGIEGFIAAPIGVEDAEKWGAIVLGGKAFDDAEERALGLLADAVAPVLEGAGDAPAGKDPMTGLPNRSSLYRVLDQQLARDRALTVLAAGLDGFRGYNRAHGPDAGDEILRRVGRRLGEAHRHAFRYGGDEFVVLVPGKTGAAGEREAALALRRLVSDLVAEPAGGLDATVGASVGFVGASGEEDAEDVLETVLDALAEARGRPDGVAGPEVRAPGGIGGSTRISRIVLALAETAEIRGPYMGEHSKAVARIARRIGEKLSLSEEQIRAVEVGSLLHDVGKIGVPDYVLFKPDRLTAEEYELIKSHPELGARILAPIPELGPALPVVKHHHERFDGKGYPDGLGGEDIPLVARVVSVADAFDAMIRARPYGRVISEEEALTEIERNSGTQFDPRVVRAFSEMMAEPDGRIISSAV